MKTHTTSDPGLKLAPHRRWLLIALIIACLVIAIAWALTDTAGAATAAGNRGGCGQGNLITLSCNVSDAGPGFVSGACDYGHFFSRVATARTFRIGQIVTARGCEGLNEELYAPIRITR